MSEESPSSSIDFGSLAHTPKFTEAVLNLNKRLGETENIFKVIKNIDSDKLVTKDKVSLDLYTSYSLSSLFWLYLRATGTNPSTVSIKTETNRVREAIGKAKKVYERKSLMPRLDKGAAKRFVQSGLWKPDNKMKGGTNQLGPPNVKQNKKTIFDEGYLKNNEGESPGPSKGKQGHRKTEVIDLTEDDSPIPNQSKRSHGHQAEEEKTHTGSPSPSKSKRGKKWPHTLKKFQK